MYVQPKEKKVIDAATARAMVMNESISDTESEEEPEQIIKMAMKKNGTKKEALSSAVPSDWYKVPGSKEGCMTKTLSLADMLSLSSKMEVFIKLLMLSVQEKSRMILFSQSIPTLGVIEMVLQEKLGWRKGSDYFRIDGTTRERMDIITSFNNPKSEAKLMLISTKAGNMGINLQAANRVVLFDCSWNPVHDLQAIYRSYRLGQKKDVFVYRLVSCSTIEEKIYKRQISKQALAARVVDNQMPENMFTRKEQADLFKFDDEADAEVMDMVLDEVLNNGTKDTVLHAYLSDPHARNMIKYMHDQDTMIADVEDEHLGEEEEADAMRIMNDY